MWDILIRRIHNRYKIHLSIWLLRLWFTFEEAPIFNILSGAFTQNAVYTRLHCIHLTDQDAGSLINKKANIQPLIRRDMNYSIRHPLKCCPFLFQALIQNENVEIKLQQDVHNLIVGCIVYSREARENLLWKNLWEQNAPQQCCFSQDLLQRRTPSHAICMLWPSLKLSNYTVCWMASRTELILRDI